MKTNNYKSVAVLFVALCLLASKFAMASDWVSVGGNVYFGTTPVCALVLINGQTQFSCDGTGRYDMQVPVDDNGMITVMVFADGFAPSNQTVTPEQAAAYPINILLDRKSPSFQVETTYEPSATEGWFIVSGTINSGTTPVCALALANGQSMFSCAENLGIFSLDVPPDQDGNITLMVFASGFKPYKLITNVFLDGDQDGIRDYLDYDDDNDGIIDIDDVCPLDSNLKCGEITDTVVVNGKEWAQPIQFAELSWKDINNVCPVGICNGVLNGYDMKGWMWASVYDMDELFNFLEPSCDFGSESYYCSEFVLDGTLSPSVIECDPSCKFHGFWVLLDQEVLRPVPYNPGNSRLSREIQVGGWTSTPFCYESDSLGGGEVRLYPEERHGCGEEERVIDYTQPYGAYLGAYGYVDQELYCGSVHDRNGNCGYHLNDVRTHVQGTYDGFGAWFYRDL